MIGKQETDRIVAAIAESLSADAVRVLDSANIRGGIRYMLSQKMADELRDLVHYQRGEFPRYRITGLGRAVAAKMINIKGGDRVYLPGDDRRTYGTVLRVSHGEASVRWGATPDWPIHEDCHLLADLIKIGAA